MNGTSGWPVIRFSHFQFVPTAVDFGRRVRFRTLPQVRISYVQIYSVLLCRNDSFSVCFARVTAKKSILGESGLNVGIFF